MFIFKKTIFLSVIAWGFASHYIHGQRGFENPIHLSTPLPYISSMALDVDGFLWLSGDGLYRYDGIGFQKFPTVLKDSTSILAGDISNIYHDSLAHELWLTYPNRNSISGLSILDLRTGKSHNHPYVPEQKGGLPGAIVTWSTRDKFGSHWVSVIGEGLCKYNQGEGTFEQFAFSPKNKEKEVDISLANSFFLYTFDNLNDSLMWLGSQAGLLQFNVVTGFYKRYSLPAENGKGQEVFSFCQHENGTFYLSNREGSFFAFNGLTEQFRRIHYTGKEVPQQIPIKFINQKSEDRLWLTHKFGIMEFDIPSSLLVGHWEDDLPNEKLYGIQYTDRIGRRYISKDRDLFIFDPTLHKIQPYPKKTGNKKQFSIFRRICEDEENGKIWLASQASEGLYRMDSHTGAWEVFPPEKSYFVKNLGFQAWDVLRTKRGELLVLEKDRIYVFSEEQQKIVPYQWQPPTKGAYFKRMIEDRNGNLWIGTHYGGLIKFDPIKKTSTVFKDELVDPDLGKLEAFWDLKEDRNGNIWIRGAGYSVYDVKRDTFFNFPFFLNGSKKVLHTEKLTVDADGNVWVMAHPTMIGITDADHPELGIVRYLTPNDGLISSTPTSLGNDAKGNIWIGSEELQRITSDGIFFRKYVNMFFGRAISSIHGLSDGRILLGFKELVGIFHPDSLPNTLPAVTPYISQFKVFEEEKQTDLPLHLTKDIYLQPNENFFSFVASAINPAFNSEVTFKYKLEGIDPDWVYPSNRRYISYTDIGPGTHLFRLDAMNEDGIWSGKPFELRIHVAAPWYRRWWAWLSYFTLAFLVSVQILMVRRKRKTLQLNLEKEHREAERLKEVNEFKTRLFTNITHEFRTPLTVMLGLADEVEKNPAYKTTERLQLLKKNGRQLLRLINQLLDLARMDNHSLKLELIQDDIIGFMQVLTDSYQSFAFSKHIGLQFFSEENKLTMDFDPNRIQHLLNNLLSNAFKFTPEHGQVLVFAKKIHRVGGEWLEIRVKDTGVGIPPEEQQNVFSRFYRTGHATRTQSEGTGIGLAFVKELVEMMQGRIWLESQPEKGTTFFIQIPIHQTAPLAEKLPIDETLPERKANLQAPVVKENLPDENNGKPIAVVIEDNADVQYYIKECLRLNWQVLTAHNGQAGMGLAFDHIPDVIISDVMMPGMNGFEVCEKLKSDERTSHIPVLLLTAKATQEDKLLGLSKGADAYLVKPFDRAELLQRLDNFAKLKENLRRHLQLPNEVPPTLETIFLEKVKNCLNAHLPEVGFSSAQLCQELGMSRSQLHRKIKALTGHPTSLFIRKHRLHCANELLETTDLSVSEVAYNVGFDNLSWFSQAFREEFGHAPRDVRR